MNKAAAVGATLALSATSALVPSLGAHAATVTAPCASARYTDATVNYDSTNTNWFDTCIPLYGRGKTEFTITSDVDFPADFKDLNDSSVTVTSNINSAAADTYFGGNPTPPRPYLNLSRMDDATNPKLQRYRFGGDGVMMRISGVEAIAPSALPAACTTGGGAFTYANAYKVTYLPTVITFDQVVAGKHWIYKITAAPRPTYLGMTSGPVANPTYAVDESHAICWSDGVETVRASDSTDSTTFVDGAGGSVNKWSKAFSTGIQNAGAFPTTQNTFPSLGVYARDSAPAAPTLPNTGLDDTNRWAWLTAGLAMMAAGGVVVGARRRRKGARSK